MKHVVVAYVVIVLLAVALAWLVSQLPAVRGLDNRVLGETGLAVVASVVAAVLLVGTVLNLAHGVWGVAVVFAPVSAWVAYWTWRRWANLRRAQR